MGGVDAEGLNGFTGITEGGFLAFGGDSSTSGQDTENINGEGIKDVCKRGKSGGTLAVSGGREFWNKLAIEQWCSIMTPFSPPGRRHSWQYHRR